MENIGKKKIIQKMENHVMLFLNALVTRGQCILILFERVKIPVI